MKQIPANIVLIGMPGVGKSTVGVLLAKSLKRPFLDTDLLVQTTADRFLQEIINAEGMDAFLDLEARVVTRLEVAGTVIATGGSVVYREAAMHHLCAHGRVIFLAASLATLSARLRDIATRGIAHRPGQDLTAVYEERQPLYARYAELTITTDGQAPEDVVTAIMAAYVDGQRESGIKFARLLNMI